jgi:hypothetical protein
LFVYVEGGKRLPAPNQDNILTAEFDSCWFWYIPLSDTLTSVGAAWTIQMRDGHPEFIPPAYIDSHQRPRRNPVHLGVP